MVRDYAYLGKIGDRFYWVLRGFLYARRGRRDKPEYLGRVLDLVRLALRRGVLNAAREIDARVRARRIAWLAALLDSLVRLAYIGAEKISSDGCGDCDVLRGSAIEMALLKSKNPRAALPKICMRLVGIGDEVVAKLYRSAPDLFERALSRLADAITKI